MISVRAPASHRSAIPAAPTDPAAPGQPPAPAQKPPISTPIAAIVTPHAMIDVVTNPKTSEHVKLIARLTKAERALISLSSTVSRLSR